MIINKSCLEQTLLPHHKLLTAKHPEKEVLLGHLPQTLKTPLYVSFKGSVWYRRRKTTSFHTSVFVEKKSVLK
jgi:hypothetical protein